MHEASDPALWRTIGYCGHLGRLCTDQILRRAGYDVTPVQSQTLLYLSCRHNAQEVSQRDLERELHLKASTINGVVGRLEEKGYITRRASPYDGRIRLVSLTDAGRSKVEDFRTALEKVERCFFADLSDQEREQLCSLLGRIIANLENEVNNS